MQRTLSLEEVMQALVKTSEIEFTEACFGKLVISLSRVVILRSKVKGM